MKKIIALIILLSPSLLLTGCGTTKNNESDGPLMTDKLAVFTYGDPYKELEKKLRLVHGRSLTEILDQKMLFLLTEYVGDSRDIAGYDTRLRITFLYAQQGSRPWPLEVKAHYILEYKEETLFNQVYQISATQYNAPQVCPNCSAEQTALKMLNDKVVPELILAVNKYKKENQ
ncbi:MAG: hypothetical protein HWE27_09670 [Gammaproteobacteria bacterium]|nr:hypothetical protein [Gammaproteobacteria bacterium]